MTRRNKAVPEEPGSGTRYKKGRRPHNARQSDDYLSLEDLVRKVASEPRKVMLRGKQVEMSRCERTFRLVVDRALDGRPREVAQLLRHMLKYPTLSKSFREEVVIFINGSDCYA
jgi:hypothetical protein